MTQCSSHLCFRRMKSSSLPTSWETIDNVFPVFIVLVLRPKGSTLTRSLSSIEYEYHFIEYECEVRLEM